jgi:hypothetical protein
MRGIGRRANVGLDIEAKLIALAAAGRSHHPMSVATLCVHAQQQISGLAPPTQARSCEVMVFVARDEQQGVPDR